jgi:hypothetical protein
MISHLRQALGAVGCRQHAVPDIINAAATAYSPNTDLPCCGTTVSKDTSLLVLSICLLQSAIQRASVAIRLNLPHRQPLPAYLLHQRPWKGRIVQGAACHCRYCRPLLLLLLPLFVLLLYRCEDFP